MKKKWILYIGLPVILVLSYVVWINVRFKPDKWEVVFKKIGTSSSARAVDLNGDGVDDIVMGAGYLEFSETDMGVLALNGVDGSVLWKVKARNQVVGSPSFMDITGDLIPDVFIGGRSAIMYCIDGKSGDIIWEYLPDRPGLDIYNDTTVLNFYNPQFIPDMTGDTIPEMLTAFGGFIKAKPDETDRPFGYLLIINSLNGAVLKQAKMPDNLETYMSPVVHDFTGEGKLEVIFGSGGETIKGSLYRALLSDILSEDLSKSIILDSGTGKGFIAPPVLADVNQDGIHDIVVNSVNGRILCFDGKSNVKLWETSIGSGFEVYTTPGPGNFVGDDKIPDFFVSLGKGVWPVINYAINVVIDGKNGKVVFRDSSGTFQYASPVVFDLTRDGYDDVVFPVNTYAEEKVLVGSFRFLQNEILVYDIRNKIKSRIGIPRIGTNLGSTPLLTDLDGDNWLDIIYCYSQDGTNSFSFNEMKVERLEVNRKITEPLPWGSYMGSTYTSVYETKE